MTLPHSLQPGLHRVLLLPGWQNSGPEHWQTRWETAHGFERVQQADWMWPRRGDWMARLEDTLLADDRPALLVAHSLGCHLVAAWAAHSAHPQRVSAAFLVAPPDLSRDDLPPQVTPWRPAIRSVLPFASLLVHSDDDPYCIAAASQDLAASWGAPTWNLGACGHVNAESGLGDWPQGLQRLAELANQASAVR